MDNPPRAELRQELRSYQIFFIVLSAVIGSGVLGNAQVIEIAGPYGLLVSVCVFGLVTLAVGETISELVQLFPAPNAIVEYIYYFIDPELAWVVGFAYWYAYATIFSYQMRIAMNAAVAWGYGGLEEPTAPWIFYLAVPIFLVLVNLGGVKYFGWIETIGGAVKLVFLLGIIIALFVVAEEDGSSHDLAAQFQHNINYAGTSSTAALLSFPLIGLGFVGVEGTTMAAFEARTLADIRWASRVIHWVTFVLYLICAVALCQTVKWDDPNLPDQNGDSLHQRSDTTGLNSDCTTGSFDTKNSSLIASLIDNCETQYNGNVKPLTDAINAFVLYSSLSAGNTAFYIASRTLYGLAYKMEGEHIITRTLRTLCGHLDQRTGVPARAVVITWALASWITAIDPGKTMIFIGISSSMACLAVWAALCVVLLRYQYWQWICVDGLQDESENHHHSYAKFVRGSNENQKIVRNITPWLQPFLAIIGLTGCLAVFVFASAIWWDKKAHALEVLSVYFIQAFLLVMWVTLKLSSGNFRSRWWVHIDDDGRRATKLKTVLRAFMIISAKSEERGEAVNGSLRDPEPPYTTSLPLTSMRDSHAAINPGIAGRPADGANFVQNLNT